MSPELTSASGDVRIRNIGRLYTMCPTASSALGCIEGAELHLSGGKVSYAGTATGAPNITDVHDVDAGGNAVIPAMVDCHTHTLYAGSRADEYALRSRGASYAEIHAAGGGIVNTCKAVRETEEEVLAELCADRLRIFRSRGVCTIEIKSGYGLDVESECKSLRAARKAGELAGVEVLTTCLAAHAIPPEHKGNPARYTDVIVNEILPAVTEAKLADFCDIFIEQGSFNITAARRILGTARDLGMKLRVHAEQLSHSGGTALAAELGVLSVSHLEHCTDADIRLLADANVCVEVLAGAQVFLGMDKRIPGKKFMDAGLTIAVASDFNPGSSNIYDLPLCGGLAVSMSGLDTNTALLGMTRNAGLALGRPDLGILEPGAKGAALVLQHESIAPLLYGWGQKHVRQVIS